MVNGKPTLKAVPRPMGEPGVPRAIVPIGPQHTFFYPVGTLLTWTFQSTGEFSFFNYGPGDVWLNWTGGIVYPEDPNGTLVKADYGYAGTIPVGPAQMELLVTKGDVTVVMTIGQ